MILQEGSGVAIIPTLAKKITSELAEVTTDPLKEFPLRVSPTAPPLPRDIVQTAAIDIEIHIARFFSVNMYRK